MITFIIYDEQDNEIYCRDCGGDDLACLGNYANGEEWKWRDCGLTFIRRAGRL